MNRTSTARAVVGVATACVLAACSGPAESADTMVPLLTTTTVVTTTSATAPPPPPTPRPTSPPITAPPATGLATTTRPSTTTTPPATTTRATSTTTTVPRTTELLLRRDGIGDAAFGVAADEAVDYIRSIAGVPTSDSGWADPMSTFGVCPGTEVRGVTWGDLLVLFSDESSVVSGRRHFFSYSYGPAFVPGTPRPPGMRTPEGITVGSTVGELRAAYPDAVVTPADGIFAANFHVDDNLNGFLTGDTDADTVQSIIGGVGCGE